MDAHALAAAGWTVISLAIAIYRRKASPNWETIYAVWWVYLIVWYYS